MGVIQVRVTEMENHTTEQIHDVLPTSNLRIFRFEI